MFYETDKNDYSTPRSPFKSCVVPRAIGWISTLNSDGVPNLAPYSQFTNLSFDPPLVMVAVNYTTKGERKHTTLNIEETGEFVYNMVTYDLRDKMNITAADYPMDVDEFEMAGLTKAPSKLISVPRVAESPVTLECKYVQTVHIPSGSVVGAVDLIIGRVVAVHIHDDAINEEGKIDIEKIKPLARLGYGDYTVVEKAFEIPPAGDVSEKDFYMKALDGQKGVLDKKR